jgi:hypothetical protein
LVDVVMMEMEITVGSVVMTMKRAKIIIAVVAIGMATTKIFL